jgi:hypothetical protein
MICQICNNPNKNRTLLVREVMFGSERAFTYLECSNCSAFRLSIHQSDMRAMPPRYHSFQKVNSNDDRPRDLLVPVLTKKSG